MRASTKDIESEVAHRPWPLPRTPWIMFQSWQRLLFAHWPVPAAELRRVVPPELTIDEFDGSAWVGLTPFVLRDLRLRCLPPIPGASDFPEMNLRTYVRVGDLPGIFFFSLDAGSRLAVRGARTFYRLPYRDAHMEVRSANGRISYRSRRPDGSAEVAVRYEPVGDTFQAARGSLEHFLTERYALYVVLKNRSVIRGDIHHRPWDLQRAEAELSRNTVAETEGIRLPDIPPLLHYSARQDTLVWAPRLIG